MNSDINRDRAENDLKLSCEVIKTSLHQHKLIK